MSRPRRGLRGSDPDRFHFHRGELRAGEPRVDGAVEERRHPEIVVAEVAGRIGAQRRGVIRDVDGDVIVERGLQITLAELLLLDRVAAGSVVVPHAGPVPRHPEGAAQRARRRHREVPDGELERHLRGDAARDHQKSIVGAGRRSRGNVDVDQHGDALPPGDVEREGVALLAHDRIDVGDQRIGPQARGPVAAGGRGDVDQRLAIQHHVAAGDRVALAVVQALEAQRHARGGPGHHHLEGLELVPRGRKRGRGGRIGRHLRHWADLGRAAGGPDLRRPRGGRQCESECSCEDRGV